AEDDREATTLDVAAVSASYRRSVGQLRVGVTFANPLSAPLGAGQRIAFALGSDPSPDGEACATSQDHDVTGVLGDGSAPSGFSLSDSPPLAPLLAVTTAFSPDRKTVTATIAASRMVGRDYRCVQVAGLFGAERDFLAANFRLPLRTLRVRQTTAKGQSSKAP